MRTLKHAVLSLWRKPTKALMIFIIMFIVFGLVFTGIIIQNSIGESKRYVRIEMGGQVEYVPDNMTFYQDQNDGEDIDYELMRLSTSVAEEIAKDSAVIDFFYVINGGSQGQSLVSGNKQQRENEEQNMEDWPDYVPQYYFQFTGTNAEKPIEFQSGKYVLSEGGRFFTEEEMDTIAYVIIVSEEVRQENDLELGDTISFVNQEKTWQIQEEMWKEAETNGGMYEEVEPIVDDFEVIGFFSGATDYETDRMFMPYETIKEVSTFYGMYMDGEESEVTESDMISNIYFLIEDPLEMEAFIERNLEKMPSKYTTLRGGESQYEQLTKPLDLMEMIATILIWVIFIAGALIIVSIVTIFVRDRRFEVGLLLSAGESKAKIVFQFIFEIMIVALLAFIMAVTVSQASSGFVANWIIENQLVEGEQTEAEQMLELWGEQQMQKEVTMENIAEEFNVGLSVEVILKLLLISFGLLIAASLIPLLIIVAYKPRKALQD